MSIENFLANLDKNTNLTSSILTRYEDDIQKLIDKKIKQTIIIEYLFSVDEEIKNKYDDPKNIKTLKVMVSNFIKKLKSKKRRSKPNENNVNSNSSNSKLEEPENKTSNDSQIVEENQTPKLSIFQKIAQKNNITK